MLEYSKWESPLSFIGLRVPHFPTNHWSETVGWVCINAYFVEEHVRKVCYVGVSKLECSATSNAILRLLIESMTTNGGMSLRDLSQKIICVGVDGCSVMHGIRAGFCVQLKRLYAPYMVGIHCMAHRTNLAYKILQSFDCVQKIEDLVRKAYVVIVAQ